MDKFGYIKGRRGPRGPPGQDAVNIFTWFSVSALRMFRENSACTFYFNTADDGILKKDEKPIGLKDRYGEMKRKSEVRNAICIQNFQQPQRLKTGYYGIPLKDSLYRIPKVQTIAELAPSIMTIALSFRLTGSLTQKDHYIVTNEDSTRGVSISKTSLNILGSEARLELEYDYHDWNTIFIQYSLITKSGQDRCIFQLNGRRGFFNLGAAIRIPKKELFIGGHPEKRDFANVVLGSFDVYTHIFDQKDPPHYIVPDGLISEFDEDMEDRVRPL